ncbi:hypothetical protein MPTK1_6g05670 [Marchantia polymorpha subsp. ruderalis]|uniref:Uncharacterized protein n=2 Tax=Marchantia polymorpha TaxID=3197 RepID=A0AAF6BNW4_MARPO|nr:hypothetical protein MARPO_0097s0075 [Marchantia polymorpha]PTQ32613.1 hypothetical protein MARPO_0097s0075 [Marchantia polymorpha]BBN13697.1 hypothetical protein Mp_6g05670 [Marchantia polymorpha subsp. ruderalis]BBN13698.1 hypothetical protein Mp_6g05670 [Marchantia polymorpha subsp. ruderalis]|eukprot:PTQ32608.1 hypothetical protein MARPO_0097s0075 [Marchantia polymorpha]
MTQLAHEEYQETKWRGKPRHVWGNYNMRPRDEENVPPNLDYKAIEQIADGVEKMIRSWGNGQEREPYLPPCMSKKDVESCTSSPAACSIRGLQKNGQTSSPAIKSPLSEKGIAEDGGCNYMCPVQIQDGPGGVTTEISITGKCPAAGIGSSSISQIVRAESITNKDTHAEKSVTKTATYWYMESSNGNNPAGRVNSRQAEEIPESTGRTGGFRSTFNQSCYNDNVLGPRCWSTEDTDARPVLRSEGDELLLGNEAGESPNATPFAPTVETKLKNFHRKETKHSRKKETLSSKSLCKANQELNVPLNTSVILEQERAVQPRMLLTQIKPKDGALEVPPLPRVNIGNFDAIFDSIVIDDELLEKKLAALTTMPPTPLVNPAELSEDQRNKQVQDLQIALLECAMEYELKTIELKMKMKSLQTTSKQSDPESKSTSEKTPEQQMLYSKSSRESQIVESMKKQIFKLQREKAVLTKEFLLLQKKERKFETQQRSLDDALLRVNRLTKEVVKKEHELMEAQLIEKQTMVQLQETQEALAKAEAKRVPPNTSGMEPAKLVAALPSLREWIRTLKKDNSYEPIIFKMVDGYYSPGEDPDHTDALKPKSANETAADGAQKVVERMVHTLMKEVQALQRELGRLGGCRSLKPKPLPPQGVWGGQENKPGRTAAAGGSNPNGHKRFCAC